MIVLFTVSLFTAILGGYLWVKSRYKYWERRRIPYLKPDSFLYGNDYDSVAGKLSLPESGARHYNNLAPHRFGGIYHFFKPVLYIRDPALIKNVLIKDFQHFEDHDSDLVVNHDPLTLLLFNLRGDQWRVLRRKVSPTFTSGKLKMLFELTKGCVEEMKKIIDQCVIDGKSMRVKDLTIRYTVDVVKSCAFGLEADSLKDENSKFRAGIEEILNPVSRRRKLRDKLFSLSPALVGFLRIGVFPERVKQFLVNLVQDTIEYRKKHGIVRNDFINLMTNMRDEDIEEIKNVGLNFNTELLAAQCFTFFNAGTRPTSVLLSFILYELAEHPDVQRKLQSEIDNVLEKNAGQITYECLKDLPYMEKVFNETSRLFSVSRVIRICTKDYPIPDSDCVIKKGESIFISPYGLHTDPQYYPRPDVFNPENFSAEAIASRPACTFLPFGEGPRNCIAKRFAVIQVELALITIMRDYTVSIAPEMKLPIQFKPHVLLMDTKDEIVLNFSKRCTDQMDR